ncbi:MAG: branched-chain amino acid ABC transporter permease, partial [Anaerolineae bacterium]|nr:branched-chain amino acid ABC transporter permease [Anaerolineae bacterium]
MKRKLALPSWIPTLLVALAIYFAVSYASSHELITQYWYQVIQIAAFTAISALGLNLIYGFNGQFSLGHIGFYAIGAYGSALITKDFLTKWSGGQALSLSWIIAGQLGILVALLAVRALRIGSLRERLKSALQGILRPYEAGVITTLVALVLAAIVVAIGAGATWLLQKVVLLVVENTVLRLPQSVAQGAIFVIALINGGTMAALVAYLVGLPLLRLGSDYFGIATLGFAIMVYTALQNSDLVVPIMKGARGMVAIPRWSNWAWVFGALVVCVIIMRNLIYSSHGRAIMSVREDEIAARTMGIDVAQLKALAFAFGGFFAGVAGGLYAHLFGFLHPSSFNFVRGFDPMIIIVFGGLGSMTGTIVASGVF